jgi:hypothetical protein
MKSEYGMKEYKELLEKALLKYNNPMECPFGMDPYVEGRIHRTAIQDTLVWCLDMLPEVE